MSSALASKSEHTMPLEWFRDILDEHFSEDEVNRQVETALGNFEGARAFAPKL